MTGTHTQLCFVSGTFSFASLCPLPSVVSLAHSALVLVSHQNCAHPAAVVTLARQPAASCVGWYWTRAKKKSIVSWRKGQPPKNLRRSLQPGCPDTRTPTGNMSVLGSAFYLSNDRRLLTRISRVIVQLFSPHSPLYFLSRTRVIRAR